MNSKNNVLMLWIMALVIFLSVLAHVLHRNLGFLDSYISLYKTSAAGSGLPIVLNVILALPILFGALALFCYRKKEERLSSIFVTLSLTFSSISIVAGGDGLVEYHFSIFMVLAILTYYDSIGLIILSTAIFAVQHMAGYFLFPQLICGTDDYSFSLLLIHAIFLILTSAFTIVQIYKKQTDTLKLEEENASHKRMIGTIMDNIKHTSKRVLENVQALESGSRESSFVSKNITHAIQEMAAGSDRQLSSVQESHDLLLEMQAGINQIAMSSSLVAESSQQTTMEADRGQEYIQKTIRQIGRITESVDYMGEAFGSFSERSQEINKVTAVISAVADQTNLLALNAAIESARAGEAGKGFAVVADEVRKLASQTASSAKDIAAIIREMQQETEAVKKAMAHGKKEVEGGVEIASETEAVFQKISESTVVVNDQLKDVVAAAKRIVAQSRQMAQSVVTVTEIAQMAKISSGSIFQSAGEQLAAIENVENVSAALNALSLQLDGLIDAVEAEGAVQRAG
ncbi:methyl-accepting chemotaxis protein [Peribacillus sp. SCS-26]|uniref:methyl-accepting chemotaxis protein n=1 Tax=Paraperibacillus marinus TaxID=3115295 RepID=UPI003905BBB1